MDDDQFDLTSFSGAGKYLCSVTDPSPFLSDSFTSPASTLDTYELVGNELISAYGHGILSLFNSEMMNYCSSDSASHESPQPSSMSSIPYNFSDPTSSSFYGSERIYSDIEMVKYESRKNDRSKRVPSEESESSIIIKGMGKAVPYSAEEKKERIERYRSKRNQRNFSKKIKYESRKTLADRRMRVKGRFARNEEMEIKYSEQWSSGNGEEDDDNWINFLNYFPPRI